MRPRNKKHLEERFEKCSYLTESEPAVRKGRWRFAFERPDVPLHLEIGCGKGAFITGMGRRLP